MAKSGATQFKDRLEKLFTLRTQWLVNQIQKRKPGKPPNFNRNIVERSIEELKALATECLLPTHAIKGFDKLYDAKKQWHVKKGKGWGVEEKRQTFKNWSDKHIPYKNYVYIFWANKKCCYVGRTLKGKDRPQGHFEKNWFQGVTRIDIYAASAAKGIPKLECLATHRFRPTRSKIKPAQKKYYTKCPICEFHRAIRSEVKSIFRLR